MRQFDTLEMLDTQLSPTGFLSFFQHKHGRVDLPDAIVIRLPYDHHYHLNPGKALRLGPGRQWGDVLEFAPPTQYSYPHGQCRSVGVFSSSGTFILFTFFTVDILRSKKQ